MSNIDSNYCYSFPAVRGQQAGKPFYIATCPLRIIPKIFMYDEEEVPAEQATQMRYKVGQQAVHLAHTTSILIQM